MNNVKFEDLKIGETYWIGFRFQETQSGATNQIKPIKVCSIEGIWIGFDDLISLSSGIALDKISMRDIGIVENNYNFHKTFFTKADALAYIESELV